MLWRALGVGLLTLGALATALGAVRAPLFDLDRFSVPKELALHLTALCGALLVLAGRRRVEVGVIEAGLLVLAAWTVLSALGATNHWLALRAVGVAVSGVVVFLAARTVTAGSTGARIALVAGLLAAVAAAAGTGVAQAHGWGSPLFAATRAPGGLLGNRNFLAHLAVIGLPLAAWLVAVARPGPAFATAALAAPLAAAVVLSRSRAAWVAVAALAVAGPGIALLARFRGAPSFTRWRAWALIAGLAVGTAAALWVPNQLDWASETPYRDSLRRMLDYQEGSGRGRLIQYRNSLLLLAHDPILGTGPGNWLVKYPLVTTPGDPSYNAVDPMPTNPWPSSDWVALLVERGPAGLALGLGLFLAIATVCVRRALGSESEARLRGTAALGLLLAVGAAGLFDAVLLLPAPTLIAMAGLGALLPDTRPLVTRLPLGPGARPVTATALVLMLAAAARSGAQLASILEAGTGMPRARLEAALRYDPASYRLRVLLAMRAPCPQARAHAERAAALLPFHPAPHQLAARCAEAGRR